MAVLNIMREREKERKRERDKEGEQVRGAVREWHFLRGYREFVLEMKKGSFE